MKKTLMLLLFFLLFEIFSFSCMGEGVYPDVIDSREYDDIDEDNLIDPNLPSRPINPDVIFRYIYYSTYENFLEIWDPSSEYFMPWENFSSLGKLDHIYIKHFYDYHYYFRDKNNVTIKLGCTTTRLNRSIKCINANTSSHLGTLEEKLSMVDECYAVINGAYYVYDKSGELVKILLVYVDENYETGASEAFCEIRLDGENKLSEYPLHKRQTLMARLLNPKTASDAVGELRARLNGTYVEPIPPWVLPTAICGGAVVLAAAVAVPTVILRRKKRKAAAATAVDATPDEGEGEEV